MLRCAGCYRTIEGSYISALEQTWHPDHFVCAACGQQIGQQSFFTQDGRPYHQRCFHERFSPRCALGGEPIQGAYLTNSWGDQFCEDHANGLARCFTCGRPIAQRLTGGGVRYADGRTMCKLCRSSAVDQPAEGERLLAQVKAMLARIGLDIGTAPTPLRLVDRQELARRSSPSYATDPSGMAITRWWMQGQIVTRREVEAILILHGMPWEQFAAVAAHELGHAWLFLQAFPRLSALVEEGLCELCEYLWLREQTTSLSSYLLGQVEESDDPIYGQGFQAARRALAGRTVPALFAYVREHQAFPP